MTKQTNNSTTIVALDVGERRIGVAAANLIARLPQPITTISNDDQVLDSLKTLLTDQQASAIVVGRPRNQQGELTAQTQSVEAFVKHLKQVVTLPIFWQDESLTSVQAEAELTARGRTFAKEQIDALAAVYILDDYLQEQS